jgi:hypothetical protein
MPRVTIPGVGNVMFPDSMSDADIMAQAKQMQTEASQPLLDPRELGIGQLIGGGFSRGIEGLKGTVADLIPAFGASMLGRDEYAREQLGEYGARMAAEEEINPTAFKSYKDIQGIGDAGSFIAETFGELGPDILSFMVGAGVGTTAGKAVAKKGLESAVKREAAAFAAKRNITGEAKDQIEETMLRRAKFGAAGVSARETGAKVGLNTGLIGTSMGINMPDVFQSIYEDTGELAPGIALTIGSLVGALDTYLPSKILKQLGPAGKERIAAELLQKSTVVPTTFKKAFAGQVLGTASGEALTESAQEALSMLGSQIAGDQDPFFSQENVDQIITSALKGFVGGSTYGAPGAAVEAKRIKDESTRLIAEREAAAQALTPPAGVPALGYTPTAMPVSSTGQAMTPEQAQLLQQQQEQAQFEARVGQPFSMEGYQGDLFEREKNLAEAEAGLARREQEAPVSTAPVAEEVVGAGGEFKTSLDADTLKGTGLRPASGFYKKLLNKDMANPEDQAAVRDILVEVRNNPNLSDSTKNAIESIAMQAFGAFAKQQEMFGPRGGVLKGADYGRARPKPPVDQPSGDSVQVSDGQVRTESAEGTAAPEEQGLAAPAGVTAESGVGEEPSGTALEPTAEEDIAEQKRLLRRRADAERVVRRAQTSEESRKAKEKLQKVDDEIDAFRAGADPRADKRVAEILARSAESQRRYEEFTAELDANKALSQEEQDAIQAELQAEMGSEAAPVVEEGKAKPARKRTKGVSKGVVTASPTEPAEPVAKVTTSTKAKKQATAKATKAVKEEKQPKVEGTKEFRDLEGSSSKDFMDFLGAGYMGFAKQDVTDIDDNVKVTNLLSNRVMVSPKSNAAKVYFSKMPRLVDNLVNMAYDLAFDTPQFRTEGESKLEAKFFQGMNGANARLAVDWVRANLGPDANKRLTRFISGFEQARDAYDDKKLMSLIMGGLSGTRENYQDETVQGYIDALQEELASTRNRAERRAATGKTKKLEADAVSNIGKPLHPAIVSALRQGDIVGALRLFGASNSGMLSKLANRLAEVIGDANIIIQENLVDEAGNPVAGFFDPKTNTIHIDATIGMNSHTLLHEAVHAVTSHILENASHVVTKQLQQLFDLVKGSLGSAYGATNLDEFVAEVKANPEMKALLQSINPNGEKINAWDKFVRIITNMLRRIVGMPPKPMESAFDTADRLIDAIISPAPDSRDAGKLFSVANSGTASKVFDRFGQTLESLPGMTPERADNVHEFLKNTVGGNFRNFMLSLLPLNALADIAKQKGLKNAMDVDRIVNERGGYEYKMNESIEPLIQRAEKFAKTNSQQQVDLFNEVVYGSTLGKVDPTKPRTDYKTPEQLAEYDKVKANYNKLNANGKALYTQMRDAYKAMYQEIINSIGQRIDAAVADPATAKLIKQDIFDKLVQKGNIDPYFPLTRYGKYWLSYSARDASGQMEFYVEAFETERERSRMMAELQKEGASDIEAFSNLSELNYRRVPSGSFVNSVLQIMELNKVDPKASEEVMRLFLSTLPETAFAQSFQKRKETLGFKKDAIRALREKMYRTSHQLASMRYAAKLNAALDQMKDFARAVGKGTGEEAQRDNRVVNEYVKEFEKRINYINNPSVSKWAQVATSFGFNMTLGFNVSSAVINLTQIPLIVLPYLGGIYGLDNTRRALQQAYGIHLRSGFSRDVEIMGSNGQMVKQKAMPALDNYNFDDPNLPPEVRRLKTLSRVATDQGQLNRSQLYDILEADDRSNPMSKINAASGFIFHHGERINRQVSLIATYNLELDRLANPKAKLEEGGTAGDLTQEQKEEYAANRAIYLTEMTNGGISAAAAPRIAQSSLGKVLFMFKRYGVSMYYMLFKTAREALKNEDPEVRKAAMKQIAGIYGTAALFAGIQGLPLFGIAAMVYNMFADDDEDDFESATRSYLGEFWYKGLFNYVTNVEIAGRTGLSDLIVRDAGKQDSQTLALTMMEMLGGPVYGVASKVERGLNMIRDGNVERGIENILPTSLGNAMKSIRYATEGTRTLRGDPITGEVNSWNIAAQLFGFAPADYSKQLEINSRLKGIDKKINQEASKIKRQYYVAHRVGDTEAKQEAKEKLLELGAKHKGLEINRATIGDILDRSMQAQERATKETVNGVRYSSKMRKELMDMAKELED